MTKLRWLLSAGFVACMEATVGYIKMLTGKYNRSLFKDVRVHRRIVLKLIVNKQDWRVKNEFVWYRDGLLLTG